MDHLLLITTARRRQSQSRPATTRVAKPEPHLLATRHNTFLSSNPRLKLPLPLQTHFIYLQSLSSRPRPICTPLTPLLIKFPCSQAALARSLPGPATDSTCTLLLPSFQRAPRPALPAHATPATHARCTSGPTGAHRDATSHTKFNKLRLSPATTLFPAGPPLDASRTRVRPTPLINSTASASLCSGKRYTQ